MRLSSSNKIILIDASSGSDVSTFGSKEEMVVSLLNSGGIVPRGEGYFHSRPEHLKVLRRLEREIEKARKRIREGQSEEKTRKLLEGEL